MAEQTKSRQTTEVQYDFVELLGQQGNGQRRLDCGVAALEIGCWTPPYVWGSIPDGWGSISPTGAPVHAHDMT